LCLESLSSCFCASLLYLVCPLKKPESFALLSLQLLSSTSTLALYTADCTGTFGPLSDWPRIALGPLHAVFNNTTLRFPHADDPPLRYTILILSAFPPDLAACQPLTVSAIVPHYACHYLLAVLAILSHTYISRLAFVPVVLRQARYSAVELDLPTGLAKSLVRDSVESLYHKVYGYVVCVSFSKCLPSSCVLLWVASPGIEVTLTRLWISGDSAGTSSSVTCSSNLARDPAAHPRTLPGAFGVSAVIHNFGMYGPGRGTSSARWPLRTHGRRSNLGAWV